MGDSMQERKAKS